VTRRDVVEAEMVAEKDRYHGVILAFNVKVLPDAQEEIERRNIKVFSNPVIYSLIGDYLQWVEDERDAIERREFSSITPLCSFRILKGYVFRRSDPAVVGVEILKGRLKQKSDVMDEQGKTVGTIRQIQEESKTIDEATIGTQVAVSIDGPMVGRQINESDRLLTVPKSEEVKLLLGKFASRLSPDEAEVLNDIVVIRRKKNPLYGF